MHASPPPPPLLFFFFNDTATTEIYTLSLHDALPISAPSPACASCSSATSASCGSPRSEEHTSELQSRRDVVCRLLLEKKKEVTTIYYINKLKLHKMKLHSINES